MGGELFKDSPVIIDELIARLRKTKVMSDEEHAVFCSSDAKKWAEWADKQLAVLLFPNLTRNFSESYQVRGGRAGAGLCVRTILSLSFFSELHRGGGCWCVPVRCGFLSWVMSCSFPRK